MIPKLTKEQFKQVYDQGLDATFALFDALQQAVEKLEERVTHLEGILAKDSHNSSKPPSSDGLKRPPKSLRQTSNKSSGGQRGHEGTTLRLIDNPDEVKELRPTGKCTCGKSLSNAASAGVEKRQVIGVAIKRHVVEYRKHTVVCSCGQIHYGDFPRGINAPVQYSSDLKGLALYFMVTQILPQERTRQIFEDILKIPLSEGTLTTILQQGHDGLEKTDAAIQERIIESPVLHADETGCDVNKDGWWIHTLGTLDYTWYFCDEHRGKDAAAVANLLLRYTGTLMHDGYKSYLHYLCRHALCNAHHLRELVFIDEQLKEPWALKMKKHLLTIKEAVEDAKMRGDHSLAKKLQKRFRRAYLAIIREGFAAQPPPKKRKPGQRGRLAQPPAKNLLDRLQAHINKVLAFMYDFTIPFTNNLAERDLRMVKVKLKVSGCFRTPQGAQIFCRIRSFVSTLRKQHLDIVQYLSRIFNPVYKNTNLLPG
jgi:transposase